MQDLASWHVSGSYFEACNCEAVCPCRQQGKRSGGRSTYGICDFALSWRVTHGSATGTDLSGLDVVLVGSYNDDEPGSPWRVVLYIDERASRTQHDALAAIFLGQAGGTTLRNFAAAIGRVFAVRSAVVHLDHGAGNQRIEVEDMVRVVALGPVCLEEAISCGIPGHDHPGEEHIAREFRVDDLPLRWEVHGRCAFASDFAYRSEG